MPEVLSPLRIPAGAAAGKIATSDPVGNVAWAAAPAVVGSILDGGSPSTVFGADDPNIDCGGVT